ncbi:hypothetical protein LJB99_05100 [Deltaproteobacteria bacterium OttesenSCG-928-K17]|nr:hypothetical protein [Deltaproteobacteria bacterium OttesenSCG-928-K17]
MTKRPYFNKSIAELEQLLNGHTEDAEICELLRHELSHRTTKRAQKLIEQLANLTATPSVHSKADIDDHEFNPGNKTAQR